MQPQWNNVPVHKCYQYQVCFSLFLIKLHNSKRTSFFSLFISQISLFLLSRVLNWVQFASIHESSLLCCNIKELQLKRKCFSSSTSPLSHLGHVLLCQWVPWYLSRSIRSAWADRRNHNEFIVILNFIQER
jgi:hypothetical protein